MIKNWIALATVFFGIRCLINQLLPAFLATLWLLSMPVFLSHSISQYADVILAGFLAINFILLLRLRQRSNVADAITFGLMLGAMTFVKDEGSLCAFILLIIAIPIMPRSKKFYTAMISSFSIVYLATAIIKSWVSSCVQTPTPLHYNYIFMPSRYLIIFNHLKDLLSQPEWGGVIFLPALLIICRLLAPWNKTSSAIGRFLSFYLISYLIYTLVRDNLPAYLIGSAYRLIYQLLPLALILLFYTIFNPTTKIQEDK